VSTSRVLSPGFQSRVFDIVRRIPSGKVTTYGRIAAMLGHPGVARHVGEALAVCGREEIPVPWHRVVNASGKISTGGFEQTELLRAEGVQFRPNGAVRFDVHLWEAPEEQPA
jgi:methylated-DNA-protein-cysteine methyltransferase-like protein